MVANDETQDTAPSAPSAQASTVAAPTPALSLYAKLARVAGSVSEVPKDGHNSEFRYSYATLGTVQAMLKPLLAVEGLLILPLFGGDEKQDTGTRTQKGAANVLTRIRMTYRIVDSSTGEFLDLPWLGEATDFGDKGFAKALTISMRTFLNQLFQIPSYDEDTDPDRAAPQDHRQGGSRTGVQRVSTPRRGSREEGDRGHGGDGDVIDEATGEMSGRLRVDQQGEPERKRLLLNRISKHLRRLELGEDAQVRLIKALTEGRGSKLLALAQLEDLNAKVQGIQTMSEIWEIVNRYEAQKQAVAEGGEELFEGSDKPPANGAPAEQDSPADPSAEPVKSIDLAAGEPD